MNSKKVYVNFVDVKGNYRAIEVDADSMDTVDVINALIPAIKKMQIDYIEELFEDEEAEKDDDIYAALRIEEE